MKMMDNIQNNLGVVLETLYNMPRGLIDANDLQEKTELSIDELNDACNILENNGYVELLRALGTYPFDFGVIELTSSGRFEYERAFNEAAKKQKEEASPEIIVNFNSSYVSSKRIEELSSIENTNFDLSKLIKLLKELNDAGEKVNVFSVAMILRTIINHIPPIFTKTTFDEVLSNYSWTKSNRELIERLNFSLRKIADSYLHTLIRKKETIPSPKQVDFRAELDVLLCEIISILK